MYNKFKCYKGGFIERKVKPILDLKNTYYTVEDIKYDYKKGEISNNEINKQIESDKNFLNKAIDIIKKLLKCYSVRIIFTTENNRCYARLSISTEKLNSKKEELIKILDNNYHLVFKEFNNKMTNIEIHIKSINTFNTDLGDKNIV